MVRQSTLSRIETDMHKAWVEMLVTCLNNAKHPNDIVVCSQNGSFDFAGHPILGLGKDGLAGFQSINQIIQNGLKYLINEDSIKQGFVYEANDLDDSIHFEMKQYLNIWENIYFLRILTQIVNIGSGLNYDWSLSMKEIPSAQKSKYIREKIKQRLNIFPLFSKIFENAYIGQIRNAAAHSQYQVIQGGIILNNYMSDKYSTLKGVSFERWEEIYCKSFWILESIFLYLKDYQKILSNKSILPHKAVEIITPDKNGNWYSSYIAPREIKQDNWYFVSIQK